MSSYDTGPYYLYPTKKVLYILNIQVKMFLKLKLR